MKTFFKILLFLIILGFLVYLIPSVRQYVNTQLFSSQVISPLLQSDVLFTAPTPPVPTGFLPATSTQIATSPGIVVAGPCEELAPPGTNVLNRTCYKLQTGEVIYDFDGRLTPPEPSECSCQHVHRTFGELEVDGVTRVIGVFTVDNKIISMAEQPGCGFGCIQGAAAASTLRETISEFDLDATRKELIDPTDITQAFIDRTVGISKVPVIPSSVCGNKILEGAEECDDGNIVDGDGCSSVCKKQEIISGGSQVFIPAAPITPPPASPPPPPETPVPPPPPPPPDDLIKEICPISELKQFDYGALAAHNPHQDLPIDARQGTHFVSDDRFPSLWIGDTVDAPEYRSDDYPVSDQSGLDGDQDGLVDAKSHSGQIALKNIHNIRKDYGTIIVGRWEKGQNSYSFKVLSVAQISQDSALYSPPLRTDSGEIIIPFPSRDPVTGRIADMKDGWLTVLYFDAEGRFDPNVPGSDQAAINGMPNFGYSSGELMRWDGTNPGLDQIIYGRVLEPFDASRRPGEVEDYLYCDRGPLGFRYYRPQDPQYEIDCGAVVTQTQTVTSTNQPLNISFTCQQTQTQLCNPPSGTGTFTGTDGTRPAAPADNRSIGTIIQDLFDAFKANAANNTPEGRLRVLHNSLRTTLPIL